MKRIIVIFLFIAFSSIPSFASITPEIFVQTGHSGSVNLVSLNQSGRNLLTVEQGNDGRFIKIWDVSTGKEIRTVKLEPEFGDYRKIHFIDDGRFIVIYPKSAKIFNLSGQMIESINLPEIKYFGYNAMISKDKKYLFHGSQNGGLTIYSIKDGSNILLPELNKYDRQNRYQDGVAELGYGYYGIFHAGRNPGGNVDYVVYDENLNIRRKGTINIRNASFFSKFKVSPDLKYLAYQSHEQAGYIYVYSLESGDQIIKYKPRVLADEDTRYHREGLYFDFMPDGRLSVKYIISSKTEQTSRTEVVIINPVENGLFTEKKLVLDGLHSLTGIQCSPYTMNDKGMLFIGFANGDVKMIDVNTGLETKAFGIRPSIFLSSANAGSIIMNYSEDCSVEKDKYTLRFHLVDLSNASVNKTNVTTATKARRKTFKIGDYDAPGCFSSNPESLYSKIPAEFFDINSRSDDHYGYLLYYFVKNNGDIYAETKQHKLALKDRKTSRILADLYIFDDGEWIIITPDGYYNASANGDKYLGVRVGDNIYNIENYRETFFRPNLVKIALKGNNLEGYKTLSNVGSPPLIKIENIPAKTDSDSFKVTVSITDTGGGIGDVRLYLNDTSVMMDSSRSVKVKASADRKEILRTYAIKLLNGENTIKAVAFDKENIVQSHPAIQKITASFKKAKKPVLHAIVIGINEYKNPKLTLKYAAADAKLFADTLQETAGSLFEEVKVTRLISKDSASKNSILNELKKYKLINPDDVFAFYVAGHGTVDDGEYYLITSNVGPLSTEKLKTDAVTQRELREHIANIPATKKLIVIDTCNAGKLGEQLQVAMLTRGMSEDTAIKILSRAVGSTIISASTSLQDALEGYKDHGLFTYVLTEGMKGSADISRSGYVKTSDLASYVEEKVPEIAESFFKRAQYPTKAVNGQDFPIGRVK